MRLYQEPLMQMGSFSPRLADLLGLCCKSLYNHPPLSHWGLMSRKETHALNQLPKYTVHFYRPWIQGLMGPTNPGRPEAQERAQGREDLGLKVEVGVG